MTNLNILARSLLKIILHIYYFSIQTNKYFKNYLPAPNLWPMEEFRWHVNSTNSCIFSAKIIFLVLHLIHECHLFCFQKNCQHYWITGQTKVFGILVINSNYYWRSWNILFLLIDINLFILRHTHAYRWPSTNGMLRIMSVT